MIRSHPVAALAALALSAAALAGPLDPPAGPITSTPGPESRVAINATNTPGDVDSLFRITQPGSYYLAGNIAGVAAKYGIEIAASGVTVDLNGFELLGVPGSLAGIVTDGITVNTAVRNGSIRSWGGRGINLTGLSTNAIVSDLRAYGNGDTGISVGSYAVVARCSSMHNGFDGISAGNGAAISDCQTSHNVDDGIDCSSFASITTCFSDTNGDAGFECANSTTFTGCTACNNINIGIDGASGCTITGCTAYSNGFDGINVSNGCIISNNTVRANGLNGISAFTNSFIMNNVCSTNGQGAGIGAGIRVSGGDARIEGNNCAGQDIGIAVDASGCIIVRNTCAANLTNWSIVANNYFGPIINRAGTLTAAVSGDAAGSSLATTDPNANFSY